MNRSLTLYYSQIGYAGALAFSAVDHDSGKHLVGLKRVPQIAGEPGARGELMSHRVDVPVAALAELTHQAVVYIGTDASVPCTTDALGVAVDGRHHLWIAGTIGCRQVVACAATDRQKYDSNALLMTLIINLLCFGLHLARQLNEQSRSGSGACVEPPVSAPTRCPSSTASRPRQRLYMPQRIVAGPRAGVARQEPAAMRRTGIREQGRQPSAGHHRREHPRRTRRLQALATPILGFAGRTELQVNCSSVRPR